MAAFSRAIIRRFNAVPVVALLFSAFFALSASAAVRFTTDRIQIVADEMVRVGFVCDPEDVDNPTTGATLSRRANLRMTTSIADLHQIASDGGFYGGRTSLSLPMFEVVEDFGRLSKYYGEFYIRGEYPGSSTLTVSIGNGPTYSIGVDILPPDSFTVLPLCFAESDSGTRMQLDLGFSVTQAVSFAVTDNGGDHVSHPVSLVVPRGGSRSSFNFSPLDGPAQVEFTFTGNTVYQGGVSATICITNVPPYLASLSTDPENPTPLSVSAGVAQTLLAVASDVRSDLDTLSFHWFVDGDEVLVTNGVVSSGSFAQCSFVRSFESDAFVRVYAEDKDGGRSRIGCYHVVVVDPDALDGGSPGDFAAVCGAIGDNEKTWIETDVRGAGTLSFRWKVSCENRNDSLQLLIDGAARNRITGETDWKEVSIDLDAAPHVIRWLYAKNRSICEGDDRGWLADVVWTPVVLSLAEAVDAGDPVVSTSGDVGWIAAATSSASDGSDCLWSGRVPDNGVSRMETTVTGPGTLSFDLSVSGRNGVDWLDCFVDDDIVFSRTGQVPWTRETIDLGDGEHFVAWEWFRGDSDEPESGLGQAGLDRFSWIPSQTASVFVEGVEIPSAWLATNALAALAETGGDYEAAAKALAANGVNKVWECYVAGLSPTNAAARFEARVEFENGEPVVTWDPDLGTARDYVVEGKTNLVDRSWGPTNESTRFYRVKVSMPE